METHGAFVSRHFRHLEKIQIRERYTLYRAYHPLHKWVCIRVPHKNYEHYISNQINILEITHGIIGIEKCIIEIMRYNPSCLVTKWAEGIPSAHVLRLLPAAPMEQRLQWISSLGHSLQHMHSMGIIHGDIQHDNILIHKHMPTLIDFELAFHLNGSPCYNFGGTCAYMSPEMRLGKRCDTKSEQYTFALICYEWITWTLCFGHPELISLSSDSQRIILRALNINPAQRFPSISIFARALINSLLGN